VIAPFPAWLEPMAATLTRDRFATSDWVFERKSGRHSSARVQAGLGPTHRKLRHPRLVGIRADKPARSVVRERS
jgi:hypothetical protein